MLCNLVNLLNYSFESVVLVNCVIDCLFPSVFLSSLMGRVLLFMCETDCDSVAVICLLYFRGPADVNLGPC